VSTLKIAPITYILFNCILYCGQIDLQPLTAFLKLNFPIVPTQHADIILFRAMYIINCCCCRYRQVGKFVARRQYISLSTYYIQHCFGWGGDQSKGAFVEGLKAP